MDDRLRCRVSFALGLALLGCREGEADGPRGGRLPAGEHGLADPSGEGRGAGGGPGGGVARGAGGAAGGLASGGLDPTCHAGLLQLIERFSVIEGRQCDALLRLDASLSLRDFSLVCPEIDLDVSPEQAHKVAWGAGLPPQSSWLWGRDLFVGHVPPEPPLGGRLVAVSQASGQVVLDLWLGVDATEARWPSSWHTLASGLDRCGPSPDAWPLRAFAWPSGQPRDLAPGVEQAVKSTVVYLALSSTVHWGYLVTLAFEQPGGEWLAAVSRRNCLFCD